MLGIKTHQYKRKIGLYNQVTSQLQKHLILNLLRITLFVKKQNKTTHKKYRSFPN